jgi:nicotinamide-nucleotide amidase
MGVAVYAEIIAIGSELTCGSRLDTNSQWLSRELESLGWTVVRHTTLADDRAAIVSEFQAAATRSDVVLITGGLGPTLDDLTREALADAFGQRLVRDEESVRRIQALFVARGRVMPERNLCQADRPETADVLPNDCGTAPGILMRVSAVGTNKTCLLAAMPGVPAEMKPMFEQQIRPHLLTSGMQLCRKVIRTFGYGESEAERLLGDLTARGRNPEVGITASEAVISLWITARSPSEESSLMMCEETERVIRERLAESVYGDGDVELHDVVAGLLQMRGEQVALLEGATTGGQLAMWMTELQAVSSILDESLVIPGDWGADADEFQERSVQSLERWPALVEDLCRGYFENHAADYALLSSPFFDDATHVGVTVRRGTIAVASRRNPQLEFVDVSMSGNLAIFRQRAARTALNRLRLQLQQR